MWDPAAALTARKEVFTDYVRAIGRAYAKPKAFADDPQRRRPASRSTR